LSVTMPARLPREAASSANGSSSGGGAAEATAEQPATRRRRLRTDGQRAESAPPPAGEASGADGRKRKKGRGKGKEQPAAREATTLPAREATTLLLTIANDVRTMMAAISLTFMFPMTDPSVVAAKEEGRRYAAESRRLGKGHSLGPPSVHQALEWLVSLLAREVGEVARGYLEPWLADLRDREMDEACLEIRLFRSRKAYDPEKCKVTFCFADPKAMQHLMAACKAIGGKFLQGAAPKGYLERKLGEALADEEEMA